MHQGLFLECATRMQDGVTVASVTISEINFCSSKLREILKFVERAFLFKVEQGGLMDQWNAKHSPQITPGAEIRAINGSWNPLQMLEERDAKSHTIWIYIWIIQALKMRFWISFLCCMRRSCVMPSLWSLIFGNLGQRELRFLWRTIPFPSS